MSYYNLAVFNVCVPQDAIHWIFAYSDQSYPILSRRSVASDHFDFHSSPFRGFKNEYCAFSELSY